MDLSKIASNSLRNVSTGEVRIICKIVQLVFRVGGGGDLDHLSVVSFSDKLNKWFLSETKIHSNTSPILENIWSLGSNEKGVRLGVNLRKSGFFLWQHVQSNKVFWCDGTWSKTVSSVPFNSYNAHSTLFLPCLAAPTSTQSTLLLLHNQRWKESFYNRSNVGQNHLVELSWVG